MAKFDIKQYLREKKNGWKKRRLVMRFWMDTGMLFPDGQLPGRETSVTF